MYFFFSVFHQGTSIQGISCGKYGHFGGEQLVLIRGTVIELIGSHSKTGKLITLSYVNLFRFNIAIISFRFKNIKKEFFVLLDNQGNISLFLINNSRKFILSSSKNIKNKISKDKTFPYLASLNKNKLIIMICTVEKFKFSFFIGKNRFKKPIFFRSRIDIKHPSIICYHITSYETKKKNGFLTIETCYTRPYDKFMVFYVIDFDYNLVKRKIIAKINSTSYLIIPIGNFTDNDSFLIFSESLLTLVNLENKKFITKHIPFRKTKIKSSQTFISSYGMFNGKSKIFLLIANQNGDLLKVNFKTQIKFIKTQNHISIDYFDSLLEKIRFLILLKNGHLFASMDSGNHFYFQFLTLGKKKKNTEFFYPRLYYKNLKIVDELASISPILSIDCFNVLKQRTSELILLTGTSSNSSIRLLQESCCINLLSIKRFDFLPIGLYVIGEKFDFKFLIISFSNFSQCFFIGKNLEEINNNGFICDNRTLSIEKIEISNKILQATSHKIRLICFRKNKKKITEWGPSEKSFILDSSVFKNNGLYIFIILSNGKGILLKHIKNQIFVELENIDLLNKTFFPLFGVTYLNQNYEKWDIIILFCKKDRSMRIFSINKKNFMKLIGIHILPWAPESAKFFIKNKKISLLISLNNGIIIETSFDSKKGQIIQTHSKILSFSPIYISKNFFENKNLIFGSKIWISYHNSSNQTIIQCIYDGYADLVEASMNMLFICKGNYLRILKKKNNQYFFSRFIRIKFTCTPIDFCHFNGCNNIPIIALVFKENFSAICNHQINLYKEEKILPNRIKFVKFFEYNWTTGICLIQFSTVKILNGEKKEVIFDIILIRGSNGKKSISSIFFKNFFELKKNVLIVSITNYRKKLFSLYPMFLAQENCNFSHSYGLFSLNNNFIYSPKKGGRLDFGKKLNFLFEIFCPSFSTGNCESFLGKTLLGHRFLFCIGKIIMICEIKINTIKTVHMLTASSHLLSSIDVIGNRLLTTDEILGLKIFIFKGKNPFTILFSEKKNINWIIGCNMLDLNSFLIWDKSGTISFFQIKTTIGNLNKITHKTSKNSNIFLLAEVRTKYMFKKLLCYKNFNSNKTNIIFFANIDGTLGVLNIFFKNYIIDCIKKIFFLLSQKKKIKKKIPADDINKNINLINYSFIQLLKIKKKSE